MKVNFVLIVKLILNGLLKNCSCDQKCSVVQKAKLNIHSTTRAMTEKALVVKQITTLVYLVSKNFPVKVILRALDFEFDFNFSEELELFHLEVTP